MRKSLTIIVKTQIGTKGYYDILDQNKSKPKCCIKWNSVLSNNINWPTTFYQKKKKKKKVKVKCFQIRLVHRILTTNVTLNRMKVTITRTVPFVIYTMKLFPSVLELRYCTAFLVNV